MATLETDAAAALLAGALLEAAEGSLLSRIFGWYRESYFAPNTVKTVFGAFLYYSYFNL
jgi:hypothetical protein